MVLGVSTFSKDTFIMNSLWFISGLGKRDLYIAGHVAKTRSQGLLISGFTEAC